MTTSRPISIITFDDKSVPPNAPQPTSIPLLGNEPITVSLEDITNLETALADFKQNPSESLVKLNPIVFAAGCHTAFKKKLREMKFSDPDGDLIDHLKSLEKINAIHYGWYNHDLAQTEFNETVFKAALEGRKRIVDRFLNSKMFAEDTKRMIGILQAKQSNDQKTYKKLVMELCQNCGMYDSKALADLKKMLDLKIIDVNMNLGTKRNPKSLLEYVGWYKASTSLISEYKLSTPKHTLKPFKSYLNCNDKILAVLEHADPDEKETAEEKSLSLLIYLAIKIDDEKLKNEVVTFLLAKSKLPFDKRPHAERFLLNSIKEGKPISWNEAKFFAEIEKTRRLMREEPREGDIEVKALEVRPKWDAFNELAKTAIKWDYKQALEYIIKNSRYKQPVQVIKKKSDLKKRYDKPYYISITDLFLQTIESRSFNLLRKLFSEHSKDILATVCGPSSIRDDLKETIVSKMICSLNLGTYPLDAWEDDQKILESFLKQGAKPATQELLAQRCDKKTYPLFLTLMEPYYKSAQKNSGLSAGLFGCCRKPKKAESFMGLERPRESKRSTGLR